MMIVESQGDSAWIDTYEFVDGSFRFVQGGDDDGNHHQRFTSVRRFFGSTEHEVHDDDDGGPEDDLFVPEEHFAVVKEALIRSRIAQES